MGEWSEGIPDWNSQGLLTCFKTINDIFTDAPNLSPSVVTKDLLCLVVTVSVIPFTAFQILAIDKCTNPRLCSSLNRSGYVWQPTKTRPVLNQYPSSSIYPALSRYLSLWTNPFDEPNDTRSCISHVHCRPHRLLSSHRYHAIYLDDWPIIV